MPEIGNLIAFWRSVLITSRWTMDISVQTLIEQTIKALEELKKLKEEE